ncbi:MAG: sulfatase-like hydrolase/transferase, partial [Planctomycetes bacterium]|nr:sulfatase-like hydrolase/transferase [Planctomycetota bacterium]
MSKAKNILFFMTDDLNLAIASYGHPAAHTPNFDRLAQMGIRFANGFCTYPLCGPSRAATLTGQRPESFPMPNNEVCWREQRPEVKTLQEVARDNGLYSERIGKIFHHGFPSDSDEYKAMQQDNALPHTFDDAPSFDLEWGQKAQDYEGRAEGPEFNFSGKPFGGTSLHTIEVGNKEVLPDLLSADRAIEFLASDKVNSPFMLSIGFHKPHVPFVAPTKWWDYYKDLDVDALWPSNSFEQVQGFPKGTFLREEFHRGLDVEQRRYLYRGYLACVSWMDEQLGRILDAFEASSAADNTLIAFVGDHGYHMGEHGQWDKMNLLDPSLRIPLLLAGAGVPHTNAVCDAYVESSDFYPTICNLMGWQTPENHGTDLLPWIEEPQLESTRPIFAWVQAGKREGWSIRTPTHRLIL